MGATAQYYRALSALDGAALELASRFGLSVTRTVHSFVSYDGDGTLNISPTSELDEDDSLAQIVLHELAHHWVEGEGSYALRDWGLSNMDEGHLDREYAALRLQLAVLRPHGLERILHPTTVHRWFYDALLVAGAADAPLAIESIHRHAHSDGESLPSVEELTRASRQSIDGYEGGLANFDRDARSGLVTEFLQGVAHKLRLSVG